MEKMGFVSNKVFHNLLVEKVFVSLQRESNEYIICNTPSRPKKYWSKIKLTTGEFIYPDIVNHDKGIVYEIHVKGERRREYFDKLPGRVRGVNVFFDEYKNHETLVVKFDTYEVRRIKWNEEKREIIGIVEDIEIEEGLVDFLKKSIDNSKNGKISARISDILKNTDILKKIELTDNGSVYWKLVSAFLQKGIVATYGETKDNDVLLTLEKINETLKA